MQRACSNLIILLNQAQYVIFCISQPRSHIEKEYCIICTFEHIQIDRDHLYILLDNQEISN